MLTSFSAIKFICIFNRLDFVLPTDKQLKLKNLNTDFFAYKGFPYHTINLKHVRHIRLPRGSEVTLFIWSENCHW